MSDQSKAKPVSAGFAYLQAAWNACPRSLGDRERTSVLHEAMRLAVRSRFPFDKDEGAAMSRYSIQTSVGVFRPLDYYLEACCAGGSYARMWETHHKFKPWIASRAVVLRLRNGRTPEFLENNRVAPHMGVLLPQDFAAEEPELASYQQWQVWWCTSQSDGTLVLCRYRLPVDPQKLRYSDAPFYREGSPARVRKLTREEWAQWNPKVIKEQPASVTVAA